MNPNPSPISNFSSPILTLPQKWLTEQYERSNFFYRLNRNHDIFLASTHWEAMGELERLFSETLKGTLSRSPTMVLYR